MGFSLELGSSERKKNTISSKDKKLTKEQELPTAKALPSLLHATATSAWLPLPKEKRPLTEVLWVFKSLSDNQMNLKHIAGSKYSQPSTAPVKPYF